MYILNKLIGFGRRVLAAAGVTVDQGEAHRSKLRMSHHWRADQLDGTCYDHDITSYGLEYDLTQAQMHRSIKAGSWESVETGKIQKGQRNY